VVFLLLLLLLLLPGASNTLLLQCLIRTLSYATTDAKHRTSDVNVTQRPVESSNICTCILYNRIEGKVLQSKHQGMHAYVSCHVVCLSLLSVDTIYVHKKSCVIAV
jgi:hypothetical protein